MDRYKILVSKFLYEFTGICAVTGQDGIIQEKYLGPATVPVMHPVTVFPVAAANAGVYCPAGRIGRYQPYMTGIFVQAMMN